MKVGEEQSNLSIMNHIICLQLESLDELLIYKEIINENIVNNKIVVLSVILNRQGISCNMDMQTKEKLYKWLSLLEVLTIVAVDNPCYGDLAEFIMMFDIRLGGKNLSIHITEDDFKLSPDYYERCQLLLGDRWSKKECMNKSQITLLPDDFYFQKLINKVINFEEVINEVEKYIHKVIGSKDAFHIKSIMKCFNSYKTFRKGDEYKLLEEAKQFYILIIRNYLNERSKYENSIRKDYL